MGAQFRITQAFIDGRLDEVEDLVDRARGLDRVEGAPIWTLEMARLRWEQGRMSDVEALVRPLVERPPTRLLFKAMLALADLGQGADEPAGRTLRELTGTLKELSGRWQPHFLAYLGELSAGLADVESAGSLYDQFTGHAGQVVASTNFPGCPGSVDRYLGMLATVLGRWAEAEAHFQAAVRIEAALRSPPFLARTRYWYAHLLITRPDADREEARALAAVSRTTAGQLGMALLADEAGKLLDER